MNQKIIDQFKLLAEQIIYELKDIKDREKKTIQLFRLTQTKKVIDVLEKFPQEITSSQQLKGIPNIGKHSLKRIDEILTTGKLSEIKLMDKKIIDSINSLESVIGIGKSKAIELIEKHNIKNVEDLRSAVRNGTITLPSNAIKGLYYLDKYEMNIPRSEMVEYDEILQKIFRKIDKKIIGTVCGSYRRGKPTSNDIDVMIVHKDIITKSDVNNSNYLEVIVNKLIDTGIIIDSLTGTDVKTKFMGFCRIGNHHIRRIDIRFMPFQSYHAALIYFTGSGSFNRKMRTVAMSKNMLLNEYVLYKKKGDKKKLIIVKSEKEIFDILGMKYLDPEKRN